MPKQFIEIAGKSILQRSFDLFNNDLNCTSITLVLNPEHIDKFTRPDSKDKSVSIVSGGSERQDSVYSALKSLSTLQDHDRVLIHDSARAYLHADDLTAITQSTATAATLAKPVADTLAYQDGQRLDRTGLYALQTPQIFDYGAILHAHEQASPTMNYTDDTSLTEAMGISSEIVVSRHYNDKITFESDIKMAEKLLTQDYEYRTGLGFDVHAFATEPSDKKLILCGVDLPDHTPLTGHSDADVGLHTITDALLGSISMGDIGRHFPPSDNAFKDMDSAIFLQKAKEILDTHQAQIINIDLTFMCETPKITPHAPAMITRVAEILHVDERRVSIKATTTEKLGFTGRKEGIAAQAVATVKVPAL